jgi:hypothetical protein
MTSALERYLSRLARELRKHGLAEARIVEEARGHLVDAIEHGLGGGLPLEAAEREAFARFGTPEAVAAHFAAERYRSVHRALFVLSSIVGLIIAYADSRSTWNDARLTAFLMIMAACGFGMIGPRRPWVWSLAIGAWTPVFACVRTASLEPFAMFPVLLFPVAGAYAGMAIRRMLAAAMRRPEQVAVEYHDRPGLRYHFDVRVRRRCLKRFKRMSPEEQTQFIARMKEGGEDFSALAAVTNGNPEVIAAHAREHLVRFLGDFGRRTLGSNGNLESLTLLENTYESNKHVGRYLAAFSCGTRMIWTVVYTSNAGVSLHGTSAP